MDNYFSKNVKHLRTEKNITQEQLGKKLDKDYSTIGKWENGTRFPIMADVIKVSEVLDVPIEDLINKDLTFDNATPISIETVKIPILGVIKAGTPIEAQQDIIGYTYMPKNIMDSDKHYFGLKISGNSMEPEYFENDIVVFESTSTAESNSECVVMVNGYDATFKKIKCTDEGIHLIPYNTNYELKFYNKEQVEQLPVKIIAKVKYFVREK